MRDNELNGNKVWWGNGGTERREVGGGTRYLADIGEAPPVAVHVQHTLLDLARAWLKARLVHLLLGVVDQRGVSGGGGGGGGVRRPRQTRTPQDDCQREPLHPPASPSQLNSLGLQPCIGPLPHCKAKARHIRAYIKKHTRTHTHTEGGKEPGRLYSKSQLRMNQIDDTSQAY